MRKNNLKVEKFLDGEKLFKHYYETMGEARSTGKLVEWCKTQGMINSKGKAPTRMATWLSAWRWACANPEKAKLVYQQAMFNDGNEIDDIQWISILQKRAYTAFYSGERYERWCKENNLKA